MEFRDQNSDDGYRNNILSHTSLGTQGTYSRSLPALGRKLRFLLFFPLKVNLLNELNLEFQNQPENIPVVLPKVNRCRRLMSYDWTYIQTDKRRLQLNI